MADTSTLTPQPKTETRRSPVFGGIGDFFGEVIERATGISPLVNEGLVRSQEILDPERGWEKGAIANFQTTRSKEDVFPQLRLRKLQSELASEHQETSNAEALKQKRIEVNTAIGIVNPLYEDTVGDDGELRTDVKVDFARANSELETKDLKAQRQDTLMVARNTPTAPKGALGPKADMLRTFEDRNMSNPG